jgi:hypothetical protein
VRRGWRGEEVMWRDGKEGEEREEGDVGLVSEKYERRGE